jgi:hypothetical protein
MVRPVVGSRIVEELKVEPVAKLAEFGSLGPSINLASTRLAMSFVMAVFRSSLRQETCGAHFPAGCPTRTLEQPAASMIWESDTVLSRGRISRRNSS